MLKINKHISYGTIVWTWDGLKAELQETLNTSSECIWRNNHLFNIFDVLCLTSKPLRKPASNGVNV